MARPDEVRLYQKLSASPEIAGLHGAFVPVRPYGILVSQGTRSIGIWSLRDETYIFRKLGSYDPHCACDDLTAVHHKTIDLLIRCKNGWAEQFDATTVPKVA